MKHVLIGIALAIVGFACGQAAVEFGQPDEYKPANTDGGTPSDGGTTVSGLPCDVATLIQAQCVSCHSNPPTSSAPMPLVAREDFLAVRTGGKTAGQLSVERMKSTVAPMPPGVTPPSASDTSILETWVNAGMPAGSCESNNDGPRPIDPNTPATCSSKNYWLLGDHDSPDMHPGRACIQCHTDRREGPSLKIAGTVYPSVHEPDDCNSGGDDDPTLAVVEIIDANGKSTNFTPRASGNFSDWRKTTSITFPIRARVHYKDKTRVMATAVTTGDCNSCHTQYGAENAPGRIVLP